MYNLGNYKLWLPVISDKSVGSRSVKKNYWDFIHVNISKSHGSTFRTHPTFRSKKTDRGTTCTWSWEPYLLMGAIRAKWIKGECSILQHFQQNNILTILNPKPLQIPKQKRAIHQSNRLCFRVNRKTSSSHFIRNCNTQISDAIPGTSPGGL